MADNIILECTECGERDYLTKKNKRKHPERLALKKYCPRERKTTLHRETTVSYTHLRAHETSLRISYAVFCLKKKNIHLQIPQKECFKSALSKATVSYTHLTLPTID